MNVGEKLNIALCDSVVEMFSTTLSMTPQPISENLMPYIDDALISSIGFTGNIEGSISFCITDTDACTIVSKMLGMEIAEMSSDVSDGIGEVTNMIVGGIKMRVSEPDFKFEIGIPTTIRGSHLEIIGRSEKFTKMVENFDCEGLKFVVILVFKVHEDRPAATVKSKINAFDRLNQLVGQRSGNVADPAPSASVASASPQVQTALDLLNQAVQKNKPDVGKEPTV